MRPRISVAAAHLAAASTISALALLWSADRAAAACDPAASNNVIATCTGITVNQHDGAPGSSAGVVGYGNAAQDNFTITVVPGATVTGTAVGLNFNTGSVFNYGSVTSNDGISAGSANVTNSGSITATISGIMVLNAANVTNSGNITAGFIGIYGLFGGTANVINSGRIAGGDAGISAARVNVINSGTIVSDNIGIATGTGNITNSGTIIGGSGTAIRFVSGLSDTLTVLPGARFGGLVDFGGGADRVDFGPGNWILNVANFNAGLSTITTAGTPYFVTPNRIVVADVSSFGAVNRAMLDITGWISSVLPDAPVFEPATSNVVNAFAAIEAASPRVNEAFSNFPSALPYAPTPVFKGGMVQDSAGHAFWAKGFGGRREQDTTENFFGSITKGYGGAIGYTHRFTPAFQLGGFAGGSSNNTAMDFNLGSVDIDTAFGGVHARTLFGPAFLDLAFIGGNLDNTSKRNIGGGLNLETASASYGGWFVNPVAALGYRHAIADGVTLTPAIKLRYLKSQFDDYVETGSSANLTVSGWDSAVFEERAEVTLASVQYFGGDSRILFRMTGGALAQQRQGDSDVGLTFAGQSLVALAPDQRRVNGWYGSAGFDWQKAAFAVFASGEITDTSDSAVTYAGKGGLRMVW